MVRSGGPRHSTLRPAPGADEGPRAVAITKGGRRRPATARRSRATHDRARDGSRDESPARAESTCKPGRFHVSRGMCARCVKTGGRLRLTRQQKMPICRAFRTGATGLEPATSGVTGRSCRCRAHADWAGICGESRTFHPLSCGEWRARAGASGDLLRDGCGMQRCLIGEQPERGQAIGRS
jgi:hypothetical protein